MIESHPAAIGQLPGQHKASSCWETSHQCLNSCMGEPNKGAALHILLLPVRWCHHVVDGSTTCTTESGMQFINTRNLILFA